MLPLFCGFSMKKPTITKGRTDLAVLRRPLALRLLLSPALRTLEALKRQYVHPPALKQGFVSW